MNTNFSYLKFLFSLTCLLFLILFIEKVAAQVEVSLLYQNSFEKKLPSTSIPKQIKSLSELNQLTTNLLQNLHNEGYWSAKILPSKVDSLKKSNSKNKIELIIDLGKRAFWKTLSTKSLPSLIQKNVISDFERKDFLKQISKNNESVPVKTQDIEKLQQAILKYAENNGYPMARTNLDSAEIIETDKRIYFSANLTYQSGAFIQFDSLLIDGDAKIKKDFLMNYLHIQQGKIYQGLIPFKIKRTDISKVKKPAVKIMMNLGEPDQAFGFSFIPNDGVGLAREEFIIANSIKIHPLALINYKKLPAALKRKIDKLTLGYKNKAQFFIDKLAEGIGKIGAAFYPKEVIVRFSDFKTNEYRSLIGGELYEPKEENPMLGWRGASRYYDPKFAPAFILECEAIKKAREEFGLDNVVVMVPFCRTAKEGKKVIKIMEIVTINPTKVNPLFINLLTISTNL